MADDTIIVLESDEFEIISEAAQGPVGPPGVISLNARVDEIIVTFDGGSAELTIGDTSTFYVPSYSGTIIGWTLVGDIPGDLQIDVWKKAGAVPTNADSIVGTDKPRLVAQQFASNPAVSLWQTAIAPGDVFNFEIESVTGIKKAVLTIKTVRD